ncbi:MAG: NAD(P)H-dependent oxidoreductase [Bacilli bacterium]|nr:NAD(P)H-dependent oxidoreductase [Bacilli bacterium]
MEKTLITYFSASGVTKEVAEKIATIVEGDLFEIEPVETYTAEDLNWMDKQSRTTLEMADKECRPAIKNKVNNLNEYNKVIIGFPVWWYTAPRIINTFIEENDLSGKEIYIFVTSGGSSFGGSLKDLKASYPNLNFINGIRFTSVKEQDVLDWIK